MNSFWPKTKVARPGQQNRRKRKLKINKIIVDFGCTLWYIIDMKTTTLSISDQVSARYPNLLTEEIADVEERMSIYRETIVEAVDSLRKNGVLL